MSTPAPTITGTSAAHEQGQEFGWDDSGPYLIRTWQGTRAAITAKYIECVAAGAKCSVKQGMAVDTLSARWSNVDGSGGGSSEVVNDWEFFAGVVQKDFMEADTSAIRDLSADDKAQMKYLIANPPATPDDVPAWSAETGTNAAAIYALVQAGLRSIDVNAPTVRHTQTVSNSYAIKASLTNVGRIFTSGQLISDEAMPGDLLFNLPTDISSKANLIYGWFKMHPTIRLSARQKTQIVQEWTYGLWPCPLLYQAKY